ncbi:bifunctional acetate--CoA ligase family protein/GNAT family N-acetyltransferase [Streptomyces marincola]|uniref:bifunctional acetate--CoA ligase family protein/GNAT family N-acetyltransferase n=1 Tax=Streptomyces marincola TaxID=2878388 RepID=UPI001CF1912E|nr:GNAT family N-acetyltransferase [Streptomyces marincola]UCM90876.1 GNAT family N-acetyltransferase [Streptomyces marincola]
MRMPAQPPYPAHWEADVVLRDGGTTHIRPITPDDARRLVGFYERVSDQSKYYRFFAPYPRLSDRDVHRFTHHDYVDRVGLAATVGGEFLATVRYDRVDGNGRAAPAPADRAEVAFLVQDAHQGRGLASVLLEHIAAVARERGIRRFEAEVLPANGKMIKVFTDAGYVQRRSFADGAVHLSLDLEPTAESVAVMRAREQRAEARSVERLLAPRSVAVIGAGRAPGGAGRTVLAGLRSCGFRGEVYAVNAALPDGATELGGVPAFRSVRDIGAPVDLAVVAVPADRVAAVTEDCGEHGVQGLLVLAAGHTRDQRRALVARARSYGMRVIGPGAFGVINTASDVRLNASPAPRLPRRGRIGLFTQSAAIGIAVLDELDGRGAGLSTFLSAGSRADVSGNDALQFWDEDPHTGVVLMYLESVGNPRKFTRLARRTAAAGTPVVVVRGGRHSGGAPPHDHAVPAGGAPESTVSALLAQAGVIEADTAVELVDTGLLLAHQPLPRGPRVAVIGNAEALALVAHDACRAHALAPLPPVVLGGAADAADFGRALAAALRDPETDAVVVTAVPGAGLGRPSGADRLASALADAAAGADKPVVVAHLALDGPAAGLAGHGVPAYPAAERAVRALAHAVRHAAWRTGAAAPGRVPQFDDIDEARAARLLAGAAPAGAGPARLTDEAAHVLLAAYGIAVAPALPAGDPAAAAAAAARLGYPVALKSTAPHARHRADLGGVRLGLATEGELRRAWADLTGPGAPPAAAGERAGARHPRPVVQAMAPRGVDTVVRATADPAIGAVLSFGLAGPPSELLGDVGHRLLPVTDRDVAALVRSIRAAPMLFGWRGAPPADTAALEELLLRLGRLLEDRPEVAAVGLDPVVVAPRGVTVLSAAVTVAPPPPRADLGPRRLPAY